MVWTWHIVICRSFRLRKTICLAWATSENWGKMLLTSQLIQTPYFMYCCWLLVDFQVVCFFSYLAFLASLLLSQGMKYCRPVCERKLPKINQRCTKNTSKVPHLRSEEATKKQVFIHYAVNGVIRCNKDVRSRIGKKFPLVTVLACYCC